MRVEDWTAIWYKCLACHRCFQFPDRLIAHKTLTACAIVYKNKFPNLLDSTSTASDKSDTTTSVINFQCQPKSIKEASQTGTDKDVNNNRSSFTSKVSQIFKNSEPTNNIEPTVITSHSESEDCLERNQLKLVKETIDADGSCLCEKCGKSFSSPLTLKRHIQIHGDSHQCKKCGKCFSSTTNLEIHMLVHVRLKVHQCKDCKQSFSQLWSLKCHIMLIHKGLTPHYCKICERGFTNLTNLKTHMIVHNELKPHHCEICKKRFAQLGDLKRHSFVHSGVKPHLCKECGKHFLTVTHLKRHLLIHSGIKPFQCKECEQQFTQQEYLKYHMLKDHLKQKTV